MWTVFLDLHGCLAVDTGGAAAHPQAVTRLNHRSNMEAEVYLGSMSRDVHSCSHWMIPCNSPPSPAFVIRGRYWSANIDDISL